MDSIGAEVGQKMRSAIKAKLMELDCYVDDELPDYIMVMVANRRTKSQMNEDLNLFLSTKTSTFVNWLHIVLKKLKEVTVTNPDVYKKALKRKNSELLPDDKNRVKKEKIPKKVKKESQSDRSEEETEDSQKDGSSITDNLPILANKLSDNRKIIISNQLNVLNESIVDDNFDIPLLSEVNESINEQELQDIERKIRNVKNRLGLLVESDNEDASVSVRPENDKSPEQLESENERNTIANARQISILDNEIAGSKDKDAQKPTSTTNSWSQVRDIELERDNSDQEMCSALEKEEKKSQHKRITFENDPDRVPIRARLERPVNRTAQGGLRDRFRDWSREKSSPKNSLGKRLSILDRLGKRLGSPDRSKRPEYRQKEDRLSGHRSGESRKRGDSKDRDRSSRVTDRLNREKRKLDNARDRNRSRSRDRSPLRSKERNNKREPKREGILGRLGVQSKVAVIKKPSAILKSDDEEEKVVREVSSSIKVKPRVIPSGAPQPNKNLLLKAVAEAQRSIAQTPKVGKEVKPDGFYTKKYTEKRAISPERKNPTPRRLPEQGKNKLKDIIKQSSSRMRSRLQLSSDEYDSEGEYIPRPVKKAERDVPSYIPSSKSGSETESKENDTKENGKQQFIITLDGIEKLGFMENKTADISRLDSSDKKRSPSPIVYDKTKSKALEIISPRANIPDTLPIIHPPASIKNKERCIYWPGCRQGDKCEFVHPSENCHMFPLCKFGDKCLFVHPKCKFASSCTKRDCPYDHNISRTVTSLKLPTVIPAVQNCKFFPNCANAKCPFFHPKACKYGKYCKHISECTFSHAFVVNKKSMSWRSK